jgi:uncharacterized protein YcfJ
MRVITGLLLVAGGLAGTLGPVGPAQAHGRPGGDVVYARVVSVEPVFRQIAVARPQQECRTELQSRTVVHPRVAATTFAGGLIGAAVGHELAHGDSRGAITVVGGVAGALAARGYASARAGQYAYVERAVPVERCAVRTRTFTETRLTGYRVVYQWHGQRYVTQTRRHPGKRLALGVDYRPVRF